MITCCFVRSATPRLKQTLYQKLCMPFNKPMGVFPRLYTQKAGVPRISTLPAVNQVMMLNHWGCLFTDLSCGGGADLLTN